ncbi:hypothetical protein GGS23DRAFT_587769 [Durotheca rogersii]|uniref:uncharacterized protein n=1 Tax=Durotheca rogersii TaxID=419775 RepID=UPI00221FFAC1|nr:uncharacterized protein GGS23DRAFT_587769 [Durotheca rogersii]KAI5857378.1 hypothetical protein GGS23DRAFT_587769 [Durotheca rogersii]
MANSASSVTTSLSQQAISELEKVEPVVKSALKKESPSPRLAPNPSPDKVPDEEPGTKLPPGNPTDRSAAQVDESPPTSGPSSVPSRASSATRTTKAKAATTVKHIPKAAPISTTAKPVSKAPKSPNTARPVTTKPASGAAKTLAHGSSLVPPKKTLPVPSKDHDAPKKTAVAAAPTKTAAPTKKPAPIELAPPATGLAKPKPKSPTRPVKLASSLAPHTASASKTGSSSSTSHPPRQSLSRASAYNLSVAPTAHRSPSRGSVSTVGAATHGKTLRRQSSTISRPRPSLGPPPKQPARDHPVAKKEGHVDESFLARMTRPTQSSSSKASEKVPVTPPRKPVGQKKPVAKDAEAGTKKASTKLQAATNKTKAPAQRAKPANKEVTPVKEAAPVAAPVETPEAAVEMAAISTEAIAAPVAEEVKQDVVAEPAAAVPVESKEEVVEKAETAEDVAQVAVEEPVDDKAAEPALGGDESQPAQEVQSAAPTQSSELGTEDESELSKEEPQEAEEVKALEAKSEVPVESA